MVLWLDPGGLPGNGEPVHRWSDFSSLGNDALPAFPESPPMSNGEGVTFDPMQRGGGLRVPNNETLDIADHPFALFVVAMADTSEPSCFLRKQNRLSGSLVGRVGLDWLYAAAAGRPLVSLRVNDLNPLFHWSAFPNQVRHLILGARLQNQLLLRINGRTGPTPVDVVADTSTTSTGDLLLGTCTMEVEPIRSLHAVVILRGPIIPADVDAIEAFLMLAFAL